MTDSEFIQVFRPSFGQAEIDAVADVMRSGWVGLGPKTAEFEEKFAAYCGAKFAVGLNSCTAALHLSLIALGVKEGDEVFVPPLTFVSTAHAILYVGAVPVFVDVDPKTLCIDVGDAKKKISSKTKAVIPVHYGGHPCEMDEIIEMARQNNLAVIEDAAHACGAEYKGRKIGGIGDTTCFSFHAVKNLATGDGGMITTDDPEIDKFLRRLRWVGIDKDTWERTEAVEMDPEDGIRKYAGYGWYYEVQELGYKCHMNDINAAIGLVQLGRLDEMNEKRRSIAEKYNEAFADVEWIQTPAELPSVRSARHNYVIRTASRDALNLYLREKKIASGVHYLPIHLQPFYRDRFSASVPVAESVWKELLTLPLYPDLGDEELQYVIDCILDFKP